MRSSLFFAGLNLSTLYGIYIERPPKIISAARKTRLLNIPGSSQPLVQKIEGEEMIKREYDVFFDPQRSVFLRNEKSELLTRHILAYLSASTENANAGYVKLSDDYIRNLDDYSYYFRARYSGGDEFDNVFLRRGRGTLSFDCVPRMYLDTEAGSDDNETFLFNVGTTGTSKTMESVSPLGLTTAKGDPKIEIDFSNDINYLSLSVDGYEMLINLHKHGSASEKMIIDSELKNCWYETGNVRINGNADVTFNTDYKFPTLTSYQPIITAQTTSGTVDKITVFGRWYITV